MNSLLSIGSAGARAAMNALDLSAARVARAGTGAGGAATAADLSAEVVTQIQARHAFGANLQTVKTADRLLGTLIDLRA